MTRGGAARRESRWEKMAEKMGKSRWGGRLRGRLTIFRKHSAAAEEGGRCGGKRSGCVVIDAYSMCRMRHGLRYAYA
jgi:hypothetical protein